MRQISRSTHLQNIGRRFAGVRVFNQEPRVEAEGQGGAVQEVGRGEGSQPRLPSGRAENKPDAPAVTAGEDFREGTFLPDRAEATGEATFHVASSGRTHLTDEGGDLFDVPEFTRQSASRFAGGP